MASKDYNVGFDSGSLNISGPLIEKDSHADWSVREFGPGRMLLQSQEATKFMPETKDGNAWCPVDAFTDFIFGIHHRSWSGIVVVDTGAGVKKLYFSEGEIVFAATNVIDDRLGEILYRKGMLSLDHLMGTSVQVSRDKKFGQVLLSRGIFSNLQLWDALKCQVRELVRSVFMSENVYFEMHRENGTAPTQVVFTEGSHEFLESCYGYGCMYRDFVNRLGPESEIKIVDPANLKTKISAGTFLSDIVGMVGNSGKIADLLKTSKLLEVNTLAALMLLVNQGVCSITPMGESQVHADRANLSKLRAKLDIYSFMLSEVQKSFVSHEKILPVGDLRGMAKRLDDDLISTIFLNKKGQITQGSVERIFSQCKSTHSRADYFLIRVDCLIQFLLQLTLDHLPYSTAKSVRQHYKRLVL